MQGTLVQYPHPCGNVFEDGRLVESRVTFSMLATGLIKVRNYRPLGLSGDHDSSWRNIAYSCSVVRPVSAGFQPCWIRL